MTWTTFFLTIGLLLDVPRSVVYEPFDVETTFPRAAVWGGSGVTRVEWVHRGILTFTDIRQLLVAAYHLLSSAQGPNIISQTSFSGSLGRSGSRRLFVSGSLAILNQILLHLCDAREMPKTYPPSPLPLLLAASSSTFLSWVVELDSGPLLGNNKPVMFECVM